MRTLVVKKSDLFIKELNLWNSRIIKYYQFAHLQRLLKLLPLCQKSKTETMDACLAVEKDIGKVLSKFEDIKNVTDGKLQELLNYINIIKREIHEGTH